MALKEIFILSVVFLSLSLISCDDPEVMAVPEYMTELYATNEACPYYDYVTVNFPDSTVHFVDSLEEVVSIEVLRGYGNGNGNSGSYSMTMENRMNNLGINFSFYFSQHVKDIHETIFPGKYKMASSRTFSRDGVLIRYFLDSDNLLNIPSNTNYRIFEVTGVHGDAYRVSVCGNFDVELENIPDGNKKTPINGSFCITMYGQ